MENIFESEPRRSVYYLFPKDLYYSPEIATPGASLFGDAWGRYSILEARGFSKIETRAEVMRLTDKILQDGLKISLFYNPNAGTLYTSDSQSDKLPPKRVLLYLTVEQSSSCELSEDEIYTLLLGELGFMFEMVKKPEPKPKDTTP